MPVEDRFPCRLCAQTFVNKQNLQRHISCVHEKAFLFLCRYCGMAYKRKDHLQRHINKNHPDYYTALLTI